jgi:hypothetical protein
MLPMCQAATNGATESHSKTSNQSVNEKPGWVSRVETSWRTATGQLARIAYAQASRSMRAGLPSTD